MSWLPQPPGQDGGWYARLLGSALTELLPGRDQALTSAVSQAIEKVREVHGLTPGNSPSCTVALIRWDESEGTLEALALADSPIVVYMKSGAVDVLIDDRLSKVGVEEHARIHNFLREGRGFAGDEFSALVRALQLVELPLRNHEDGFWVAEAAPSAAEHAIFRSWPLEDVTDAIALSDGAAAGVCMYAQQSWRDLLALVRSSGPGALLQTVHAVEEGDPDGQRWPRAKRHDDKTIAHLQIAG
jgi:hypothetical protein